MTEVSGLKHLSWLIQWEHNIDQPPSIVSHVDSAASISKFHPQSGPDYFYILANSVAQIEATMAVKICLIYPAVERGNLIGPTDSNTQLYIRVHKGTLDTKAYKSIVAQWKKVGVSAFYHI